MYYCKQCGILYPVCVCDKCGVYGLPRAKNDDFCFFVTLDDIEAEMFGGALKNRNIPFVALPIYGRVMQMSAGMKEKYKIYVEFRNIEQAEEIYQNMFCNEEEEQQQA